MGDFPGSHGGMWPEQASPDDLSGLDTGAPTPPAGGAVFVPLQVAPTPVGNSEDDRLDVAGKSPAHFSIRYLGPAGMVTKRVPFKPGLSLKHYLKEANLIGLRMRTALVVGQRRVRLSYVPQLGEALTLAPPNKPLALSKGR